MTNTPPPGSGDGLFGALRQLGERLQNIVSAALPPGLRGVVQGGAARDGENQSIASGRLETADTRFQGEQIGDVEARPNTEFPLIQSEGGGGEGSVPRFDGASAGRATSPESANRPEAQAPAGPAAPSDAQDQT